MTHEAGKGDTQRPTDWDSFSENFERIFGSKPTEKEKAALKQQQDDAQAEDEEFNRIAREQK
jgi:ABC-type transporter Mla subunit MlaD